MSDAGVAASAWQTLGIAPTDDARAIRRAYAARLKMIDVEAEPQRFVTLRAAFEAALAGGVEPVAHAAPHAEAAGETGIAVLAERIGALLAADAGEAAADELTALTTRLIAAFESGPIETQVAGEEWIADTIVAHRLRSDAMVRPAVAGYRWRSRRHGQHRPDKATIVLDRWRELSYADLVLFAETGRHHLAWTALQALPPQGPFRQPPLTTLDALDRFFREAGDYPRIVGVEFDARALDRWHAVLGSSEGRLRAWRRRRRGGWGRWMPSEAKLFAFIFGGCGLAIYLVARLG